MLAAESYKIRMEKGLNFIEFNYMILQAYDFLYLFQNYGCALQMGGNDSMGQYAGWHRTDPQGCRQRCPCRNVPTNYTSLGKRWGKTEKGTIWLDKNLTTPYDYYQYWINCDDADLERFLKLFTFLPLEEISMVKRLTDAQLNMAKAVLAFEATRDNTRSAGGHSRMAGFHGSFSFPSGRCRYVSFLHDSPRGGGK